MKKLTAYIRIDGEPHNQLREVVLATEHEAAMREALETVARLGAEVAELRAAMAEPAPAQDEREAFEAEARKLLYVLDRETISGGYIVPDTENAWQLWQARATRPAQTEQQPVAAQIRYRHPQKTMPNWSAWQQAPVDMTKPTWWIDSVGYENEYRLLYAAPITQTAPLKPHQLRELVNDLRDVARKYHATEQLREQIANTLSAALSAQGGAQ